MKFAAIAVVAILAFSACSSNTGSTGTSSAKDHNTIKTITPGVLLVGTTTDSKPNAYLENGKMKGFDIEFLDAVARKLDLKVKYKSMEFSALLPAVANGQLDLATNSIGATVERQKMVAFADGNYAGALSVMSLPTSGITKDKSSIVGKRLGLIQGSIQEQYAAKFLPGAEIVRFPDNNSGVSALQSGRIDGFFIDTVVAADYVKQNPKLTLPIIIWTLDLPAAFALKKGNTQLLDPINKAQKEVVDDGTWLKIYKKYFVPTLPIPKDLPPYKNPTS